MKQILIDGIGATFDDFGLVLQNRSRFPEAEAKQTLIEVPGGVPFDLSEAVAGDIQYKDIQHTLVFTASDDIADARHHLVNTLSGKMLTYRLSWDTDYSYRGRWIFGDVVYAGTRAATFTVKTRTEPWRSKGDQAFRVNAAGGIVITLNSGRMPVCPTFEFASETIVSYGDITAQMQPGTYKVTDLWLCEGTNELYLNSYLGNGNVSAESYLADSLAMHTNSRLSDLIWEGIRGAASLIAGWQNDTVSMHSDERIIDSAYAVDTDSEQFAVYINYPWKDL